MLFWLQPSRLLMRIFDPLDAQKKPKRTVETEAKPRTQHLRREISLKAKLARGAGNSIEISMPNFVNRTASSNPAWSPPSLSFR
jgi:hypothetical protein